MSLIMEPEKSFADLVKRTQTTMRLLFLIVALVAIDSMNHQLSISKYHKLLPSELYDFASKYENALLMWYADHNLSPEDGSFLIKFEKVYREPQLLTSGYTSLDSIPFLEAHLRKNLPEMATGNRSFFGYQMDFQLYLIIVLLTPVLLLFVITMRVWLFRRGWQLIPSRSSWLMTDILALRSFRVTKPIMVHLTAAFSSLFMLLIVLLPPYLVGNQILMMPEIKGSITLNPVGIPILESGYSQLELPLPQALKVILLVVSIISLIASFCICIMLIKPGAHSSKVA